MPRTQTDRGVLKEVEISLALWGGVWGAVLVAPLDEHNATLVRNVHPPDWRPPTPAARYNLVVIGAGTAGLVTAAGAAGLGARVALADRCWCCGCGRAG